jgi:hypothetical protein
MPVTDHGRDHDDRIIRVAGGNIDRAAVGAFKLLLKRLGRGPARGGAAAQAQRFPSPSPLGRAQSGLGQVRHPHSAGCAARTSYYAAESPVRPRARLW